MEKVIQFIKSDIEGLGDVERQELLDSLKLVGIKKEIQEALKSMQRDYSENSHLANDGSDDLLLGWIEALEYVLNLINEQKEGDA